MTALTLINLPIHLYTVASYLADSLRLLRQSIFK